MPDAKQLIIDAMRYRLGALRYWDRGENLAAFQANYLFYERVIRIEQLTGRDCDLIMRELGDILWAIKNWAETT